MPNVEHVYCWFWSNEQFTHSLGVHIASNLNSPSINWYGTWKLWSTPSPQLRLPAMLPSLLLLLLFLSAFNSLTSAASDLIYDNFAHCLAGKGIPDDQISSILYSPINASYTSVFFFSNGFTGMAMFICNIQNLYFSARNHEKPKS